MRRSHWFGEDVRSIQTTLDELPALLPAFDRYGLGRNRFQDVIVPRNAVDTPVAAVSKNYVLVQHADAVHAVTEEIRKAGIEPAKVPAELLITEYGTRVAVRATLPQEHAFVDERGDAMALTFDMCNSVDRTVSFMAAVGWFRFVCSNGLVLGTATAKIRRRHSTALNLDEVSSVLSEGISTALHERQTFERWQRTKVAGDAITQWVRRPGRRRLGSVRGCQGVLHHEQRGGRQTARRTAGASARARHRRSATRPWGVPGNDGRLRHRAGAVLGGVATQQRRRTLEMASADPGADGSVDC